MVTTMATTFTRSIDQTRIDSISRQTAVYCVFQVELAARRGPYYAGVIPMGYYPAYKRVLQELDMLRRVSPPAQHPKLRRI